MAAADDPGVRDSTYLVILDREECLRLLAGVPIGRLAFTERALPAITPVHFRIEDDAIVIPGGGSGNPAAAADGAVVAFEADELDATTHTGWSVTAVGRAALVTDAAVVAELSAVPFGQWTPEDTSRFLRIQVAHVTGRRIEPAPG